MSDLKYCKNVSNGDWSIYKKRTYIIWWIPEHEVYIIKDEVKIENQFIFTAKFLHNSIMQNKIGY